MCQIVKYVPKEHLLRSQPDSSDFSCLSWETCEEIETFLYMLE